MKFLKHGLQISIAWINLPHTNFSLFIAGPPKIVSFCPVGTKNCSSTKVFTEFETRIILCQVAGSLFNLTHVWSYLGSDPGNPDGPLDRSRMFLTDEGGLLIQGLKRNDTGFYKCYVENGKGGDGAVMYMRVKGEKFGL